MGGHDAREHGFLVHLDVVEGLEREGEVAQQAVDAQQADDGEVAEHLVERARAVFASDGVGGLASFLCGELFVDLGALDERVEDIEHTVAAPRIWIFAQHLGFGFVWCRACNAVSVAAEGLKLVDELVYHIPCPVILVMVSINVKYAAKSSHTLGTSRSTGPSELRM